MLDHEVPAGHLAVVAVPAAHLAWGTDRAGRPLYRFGDWWISSLIT